MSLSWPPKDPDEVLDYDIDWTTRLAGDTISTSQWIKASGSVTIDSDQRSGTVTKVWLSGGTLDETSVLTNRIVTVGNRTMDQTVKLKIKAK